MTSPTSTLKKFSEIIYIRNEKSKFLLNIILSVNFVLWNNMKKSSITSRGKDDKIIKGKPLACWLVRISDQHTEYVQHTDFPNQPQLHDRNLKLRLYVHCLSGLDSWTEHLGVSLWNDQQMCQGTSGVLFMRSRFYPKKFRPHWTDHNPYTPTTQTLLV
jgi:hypothetical protein